MGFGNERPGAFDEQHVRFLGKLIMEEGSVAAAWAAIEEMFEHWDGEPEPREAERARFEASLPYALEQNRLIHPDWIPSRG